MLPLAYIDPFTLMIFELNKVVYNIFIMYIILHTTFFLPIVIDNIICFNEGLQMWFVLIFSLFTHTNFKILTLMIRVINY